MRQQTRSWASQIQGAVLRPRPKFGVDGRLLVVPILLPCAASIIFLHGLLQVAMIAVTILSWCAAKVLWEVNPWFFDDMVAETVSPKEMTDAR